MTTKIKTVFAKREMYVNEIVFYSKTEVSLFGFIHRGGQFFETQFIISRNQLQMLLSQTKTGIEILWHIEKLFVLPHSAPASLNLIELFGTTQFFEAQKIELEEIVPANNHDILLVENVVPFANGESKKFCH